MAEKAEESNGMVMEEVGFKVGYQQQHERSWPSGGKIVIFGLIAVGVLLIIIGVVLLTLAHFKNEACSVEGTKVHVPPTNFKNKACSEEGTVLQGLLPNPPSSPPGLASQATEVHVPPTKQPSQQIPGRCEVSAEAQRVGLNELLKRVKSTYFELHPFSIPFNPDINMESLEGFERIRRDYEAYDPTPSVIKNRTDVSRALLNEITRKTERVNMNALKPRERKSLAQVKHYLQHTFGQPYDVNYYAGDWMMGPNLFCWQPICFHGYDFYNAIIYHRPTNETDVKVIRSLLETHQRGILQYIENMKMGVKKGMVRSREECVAGTDSLKRKYLNVSLYNETGIWKEWFVEPTFHPDFYNSIPEKVDQAWKEVHGKTINETVKEYLLTYLGKPLHQLIRYLEDEHIHYCVPSNVSSGLGRLPLSHVWYDGKEDKSRPTDPTLPTGENLNGSHAYSLIMPYFTTNDMKPSEVHELGKKQLDELYPLVVEIAKEMTGTNDSDLAVKLFRQRLNSTESFFNDAPIPANESNKEAHKRCSDLAGAEKHCPKRWAAMQLWFKEARRVMSMLDPKTVDMFYFTGPKHTTPNCPVDLQPDLNPSSGAQSYENSDAQCSRNAIYNIPFFLENLGPRFSEWSVNAHEARPGHHTQVQGTIEHFQDGCDDALTWLDTETYYTAFTEGWALYAENPLIAEDTDTYDNEPMQQFGMLKWQIWRALRLIVDTGLHFYPNFTREDALWHFDKFAWDNTDLAQKEVTRYQSDPGQATAYMIGQLQIKSARNYSKTELGDDFSLRDFHYQVLAQGSSPLAYLQDHIKRYVDCVQDNAKEGCDVILNAPKKSSVVKKRIKVLRWPVIPRPHRHYF